MYVRLLRRFTRKLTYANVMATLALFVALGGTSYAAFVVTGANVRNGSLTGADIKHGSITTANLSANAVTLQKIAPSARAELHGADGTAGTNGTNGRDGTAGTNGTNGHDGAAGAPGVNGLNGVSDLTQLTGVACSVNGYPGALTSTVASGVNGSEATTFACTETAAALLVDPHNCGSLGHDVASVANGTGKCVAGTPEIATCNTNWADADGNVPNGCEANLLTDAHNCGTVGHNVISVTNGTGMCVNGAAAIQSCDVGYTDANNDVSDGCEHQGP